jgi:hypothetical protein
MNLNLHPRSPSAAFVRRRGRGFTAGHLTPGRLVAAVSILGLVLAACGGPAGSTDRVPTLQDQGPGSTADTNASPSASEDPYGAMLAYSQCMRDHGVANYPDPVQGADGGIMMTIGGGPGSGLDPNSPTFQAAQEACKSLMPAPKQGTTGGQDNAQIQADTLAFSQCMRDHGVANFPDPQVSSDGGMQMQMPEGIDSNSPTFQAAQQACQSKLPGSGPVTRDAAPSAGQ